MDIPSNITGEHLEKAVEKINMEGIPPNGNSLYYDVLYKDRRYPPKLIVSYANLFANGKILDRKSFRGGLETPCFDLLEKNHFNVVPKNGAEEIFYPELKKFLKQSETGNLKTKNLYKKTFKGLKVKVSFGQGVPARIPWISFLMPPHTTSEGIYPGFLNYRDINLLILSFGISETNEPPMMWPHLENKKSIKQYFQENGLGEPQRYGDSYVYKVYNTSNLPDAEEIERDLDEVISIYKSINNEDEAMQNGFFQQQNSNLDFQQPKDPKKIEKLNTAAFLRDSASGGLQFSKKLIDRFVSSLCTKPFVILTGLSGSGKTKLAQAFATWICDNKNQFCIVPVGADWTNREPLLGYSNAIDQEEYVKPENGILDLLIKAKEDKQNPYFIILDEMNLSHVERYFADFLSIMESGQDITLYEDDQEKNGAPSKVSWPKNVFIVGTVNIDETTYMFSPKVLDRANTIEFRITAHEMEAFLNNNSKPDLSVLQGKGANMAADFLRISSNTVYEKPKNAVNDTLLNFFKELKKTGAEFGYRSAAEIHQLLYNLSVINMDLQEDEKLDIAIMQKLLPKLHGSRRKLVPILKTLGQFCLASSNENIEKEVFLRSDFSFINNDSVRYPLTLEKISRMYNGVVENGFASYAEA
ncbi:MrcB family domain-containing protein [Salinimicrobium sp. CAU 1759]